MPNAFNEPLFRSLPVVGILRFFPRNQVERLIPAALAGGLNTLEITMNSEGAEDLLRLSCDLVGDRGNVGAGTVTTLEELDRALKAGASFVVTPA
ncbi:MAG: 2-dehydro-3-deoxyphosphogluconate aldolase, partial [Verrucomicrobiae bacterium]|nr:2-dehydro-3-deoxyphosphogluconate aldolase [Verrucomicrobiae bacterium]